MSVTLGKEQLVKTIAKDLYLREDVVEEVIDRFLDVAIEEIANEGELKLHRFITISTSDYKSYTNKHGVVPAHKRLKIRLSDGIHRLFKMRTADPELSVTRDNWRSILASTPSPKPRQKSELYNPLLDED